MLSLIRRRYNPLSPALIIRPRITEQLTAVEAFAMALYLVVHHKLDGQQWNNSWIDPDRLLSIATTEEIGRLCAAAKAAGERVFIHRCGWVSDGPSICCAVRVAGTVRLPGHGARVEFADPVVLGCPPSVEPRRGQVWYEADPVGLAEAVVSGL